MRERLQAGPEPGARDDVWAEDFGGFLLKGDANFAKRGAVDFKKEIKGLDDDLRPMRAGGFPFADPLMMMLMEALADPLDKIPEADRELKSWKDAPERTTTELGFSWGKVDQSTFNEKVKELEARLSDPEATEVARYRLGGGINGTYIVVLSNGAVGVWKPVERESQKKLRDQLEEDHQGRREVGAYLVDSAMGHMARVPPAVFRKLGEQEGALLCFVPKAQNARLSPSGGQILGDATQPAYKKLAVFDHTIGNVDRHQNNWLVVSESGEISPSEAAASPVPIDHGLCFPLKNEPQGFHNFNFSNQVELGEEERNGLQSLMEARATLEPALLELDIKPEAVEGMYQRAQTMLDGGKTTNAWRGKGDGPEAELASMMKELERLMGGLDPFRGRDPLGGAGWGMMGMPGMMIGMPLLLPALPGLGFPPVHQKKLILDAPAEDKGALDAALNALHDLGDDAFKRARVQIVMDDSAPGLRHEEPPERFGPGAVRPEGVPDDMADKFAQLVKAKLADQANKPEFLDHSAAPGLPGEADLAKKKRALGSEP